MGDAELPSFKVNSSGDYLLIALNEYHEPTYRLCIYGLTLVEVLEYRCEVEAPSTVIIGSPIDVEVEMPDAPSITEGYRYGAAIIHEDAYKLSFKLTSNGYVEGTILKANGAIIVQGTALVAFKQLEVNVTTPPPPPPPAPPPPPTPEEVEAMPSEEAARKLEELPPEVAAELIEAISAGKAVEIVEAMKPEAAAKILEEVALEAAVRIVANVTVEKAVEIVVEVEVERAADIMEELPPARAANITEGLVKANQTLKAAQVAVAMEPTKAAMVVVKVEPHAAVPVVEAMVEVSRPRAAMVVEEAFEVDREATVEVLNEVEDEVLVDLIIAIFELPSTPQDAAAILASLAHEKALAVVRLALARDLARYVAEIFKYLPDEALVRLFRALTLEERRLVYLAAAPELKERIPAELKPLPDLAVAFKELPAEATAGEEVSIVVEASNVGEWTAPRSEASLYVNDTLLARLPVQELSPGQSVALTATWTPTKPGTYELKVEVRAHRGAGLSQQRG
ncbi:hypothetical protein B6U99_06140 [Candidatus Geothermarchaeota archaeon ex4572_27]|nr:MAG: hypothetical protein B6U99_06140 [Candidatus Geothermarchaeota archaeon ex4572_27]